MDVKVVDASAIAALLFGEPGAEKVAEQLGEARLIGPSLLSFELANVCLIKGRRHPDQRQALKEAFFLRHRLGVEEVTANHDEVLNLAAKTGLTAYDASYLWVAQQFKAELVTLDRQLAAASTSARSGIP